MTRTRVWRRLWIAGAVLTVGATLAACVQEGTGAAPTTSGEVIAPGNPQSPAAPPENVTCADLLDEDIIADFEAEGWTVNEEPFVIGAEILEGGVSCTWADFESATTAMFMFGWAPIEPEDADEVIAELVASGWIREEEGGSIYVSADPTQSPTVDADGYGFTYRFSVGSVVMSDTKQGIALIRQPGS